MSEYRVTWSIEIDAETPLGAAKKAKWFQLHGDWSSVFHVERCGYMAGSEPGTEQVDLDEILTSEEWEGLQTGRYEDLEEFPDD